MTDFLPALPEIYLALVLLLSLVWRSAAGPLSFLALSMVAPLLLFLPPAQELGFRGLFVADDFSRYVKLVLLVATAGALALSGLLRFPRRGHPSEPVALVLFALLGMMLMVSAHDLIVFYAGLELQNLALYVLVAARREDPRAAEAGVKYFMLGALSSCILLFGFSLIYGFTGSTSYNAIAVKVMEAAPHLPAGLVVGLVFAVVGLAVKIAAFPFHMWSPDVYEGAPLPVTAFLTTAPKIAATAALVRFLGQPFAAAAPVWQPLILFLAAGSMLWGGFAGLAQTNVKRLMAYSGIVNVGTMLVGLAAGAVGVEGVLLYFAVYVPAVLGVFASLSALTRGAQPAEEIRDLAGLSKTKPMLAVGLGACLFSLSGLPPLAGFFGKYAVLFAAVKTGMTGIALLGLVASVIAAAYYLRLIKVVFFDSPAFATTTTAQGKPSQFVVALAALAVSVFILAPAPLMDAAHHASQTFWSHDSLLFSTPAP